MSTITEAAILDSLRVVEDPDLHRDIVSLGFVKKVTIEGAKVSVVVELTTPACPVKEQLRSQCVSAISAIAGVESVHVEMTANVRAAQARAPQNGAVEPVLPGVRNVLAVASGKGGVGKSTIAVNLAAALAASGARVGVLDADVYGPSVARMVGGVGQAATNPKGMLIPFVAHGMKFMSMGMLVNDKTPVIWRGPMASGLIQQFLTKVDWGELDYLVIDMPPGTGDVQLTLTQVARLSGAVIVTTPQGVASEIAQRGMKMFATVNVPVIGVIENFSYFDAPDTGKRYDIFRPRGGARPAAAFGTPLLAEIPIEPELAALGDEGRPLVQVHPTSKTAIAIRTAAERIAAELSKLALNAGQDGTPSRVDFSGPRLSITWGDGAVQTWSYQQLRFQCSCAECVDEHSGKRKTVLEFIDPNIRVRSIEPSGRYALQIHWSDGHSTGLYTFDRLRKLGEGSGAPVKEREQQQGG